MSLPPLRIAVHSGSYHSDDVFAVAIARMWAQEQGRAVTVVRTRNSSVIDECDMVFDVGDIYDPDQSRFDHHQSSYNQRRDNGIPYASAGLAWRAYGGELCSQNTHVWESVDKKLIQPIDAVDTGINIVESIHSSGIMPFDINSLNHVSQPTWQEDRDNPDSINSNFWLAVNHAEYIVERSIIHAVHDYEGENIIEQAYHDAHDKRIIIVDWEYPWMDVLCKFPEPLFIVYQRRDGAWSAKTVRSYGSHDFTSRAKFPFDWAGLRDQELQLVSGVTDARFAHLARFMIVAETQAGAIALVERALAENSETLSS